MTSQFLKRHRENYKEIFYRANKVEFESGPDNNKDYKEFFEKGQPNPYKKNEFEYRYNSLGFRCDDFLASSKNKVLFMGCSFTEGIGLPLSATWSYQIHQQINAVTNATDPYNSIALGGSSIQEQAELLSHILSILTPKAIFLLIPPSDRHIIKHSSSQTKIMLSPASTALNEHRFLNRTIRTVFDEEYIKYEMYKGLLHINTICSLLSIRCFCVFWEFDRTIVDHQFKFLPNLTSLGAISGSVMIDRARDYGHSGPKSHKLWTKYIWHKVSNYFPNSPTS